MTAILIVAHAPLASALRQCALHVFPDCGASVAALDVLPDASPEQTLAAARAALHDLGMPTPPDGLLVLTDIVGATPCNVAQQLVTHDRVRLIAGVNLPMLVRSLCYRHEPVEALAERARSGGLQGIVQGEDARVQAAMCGDHG